MNNGLNIKVLYKFESQLLPFFEETTVLLAPGKGM